MKPSSIFALLVSLTTAACVSGAPVPADKLARSESAIRSAEELGAERNAEGARYLQAAREQLATGRKFVIDGDQATATPLLLRAEADAELAMNITRESTAIADARKTRDEIASLQTSMKGGK